jgi:hypothetical protein
MRTVILLGFIIISDTLLKINNINDPNYPSHQSCVLVGTIFVIAIIMDIIDFFK